MRDIRSVKMNIVAAGTYMTHDITIGSLLSLQHVRAMNRIHSRKHVPRPWTYLLESIEASSFQWLYELDDGSALLIISTIHSVTHRQLASLVGGTYTADPGCISRKIQKFRTDKFDTRNKRKIRLMQLM